MMSDASSREVVLRLLRAARPDAVPAPDVAAAVRGFSRPAGDATTRFATAARAAGARVLEATRDDLSRLSAELAVDALHILSALPELQSTVEAPTDPHALADLDFFVCEGVLGVAENCAVWIPASRVGNRAALFLATKVMIVLDRDTIVPDLHAAYDRLNVGAEPFGTFVGGPSKTADIEQALVIGAHGPKELTIVLV